jgi:hypothetical protein
VITNHETQSYKDTRNCQENADHALKKICCKKNKIDKIFARPEYLKNEEEGR